MTIGNLICYLPILSKSTPIINIIRLDNKGVRSLYPATKGGRAPSFRDLITITARLLHLRMEVISVKRDLTPLILVIDYTKSVRGMLEYRSKENGIMTIVTMEEAQANLPELIQKLAVGEEVVITENDQPVARLLASAPVLALKKTRKLGTLQGTVLFMASDFDAPLDDFKEYM